MIAPRAVVDALVRVRTFDALHYPAFRLIWGGQVCTAVATWMDQVTRGWLLYEMTGSPFHLGLIRGFQAIPLLFLSPIAGTAADRYDRKAQIIVAQSIDAALYGVMAVLIFTGQIQPWHVYATAVLAGAVGTFENPARNAMVSDAVPRHGMTNAVALNSVAFNVSRIAGPSVAGLMIALTGTGGSYVVQVLLYAFATTWTMRLPASLSRPADAESHHSRGISFGRSTVDGWKACWVNREVRAGLLIVGLASLFIVPFSTLLPVFAKDILDVGASGQGLMLTAMGVGALVSAILIASIGDQVPRGLFMLGGIGLYGIAVVAVASSTWFPLTVVLMVIVGVFHVSSHALVQTVVQTYAEPEFRGRTMAVFHQSHLILMIGGMVLGGLASVVGGPWAMALMAGAGTISMALMFLFEPVARRLR